MNKLLLICTHTTEKRQADLSPAALLVTQWITGFACPISQWLPSVIAPVRAGTERNGGKILAGKKTTEDLNKAARREMILKLIAEKNIATQKDLAAELQTAGFDVAQATLSRDIRELHLVKTALPGGNYTYQAPGKSENQQATAHFFQLFHNAVVHIDTAMNQVVIHTYTGMAQAICAALDGMKFEGVLGTIAGDDTILVIARSEEVALDIAKKLREV